jgi:glycine/D-amino acid oxidase-like deaminating enzyme
VRIAVVGAGFSGLALSYHLLLKGASVDLYDEKGVGAGASGVSSGLLHPYVGEQVRRCHNAEAAMEETQKLLSVASQYCKDPVSDSSGIIRRVTPKQRETFLKHQQVYQDLEVMSDNLVKIHSGIVVHSSSYLKGLYQACAQKGLNLILKKIDSACELEAYDAFILAIGAGVFSFPGLGDLALSAIRGQTVLCKWPLPSLKEALLGKGHIVPIPGDDKVHLGATYERGVKTTLPCMKTALSLLTPQAAVLAPDWKEIEALECRVGIRVVRPAHATPWVYKMNEKGFAMTAMGSRGLLYHAYYGKMVADMLFNQEKDQWNLNSSS